MTTSKGNPDLGEANSKLEPCQLENQAINSDAARLDQLGLHAELERRFSLPSIICLCLCLMATWEALSSVVAQALASGGVPCLIYNYIASFLCTVAIALSLAEIASVYPTAGGQYHWVAALSPSYGRKTISWLTGWISIGGQIVLTASAAFAAGLMIQGLIVLNDETYDPQRWHGLLVYWAVLTYVFIMNTWGYHALPTTNLISGLLHIVGFLVVFISLAVKSEKNDAEGVFTKFSNSTGWSSDGVAWLVGLISTVYPFLGYDAACHLAEELPQASRNVPVAIVGSVVLNGIIGLAYVMMLGFSAGSLTTILDTRTGFPFMVIFSEATRSNAFTTVLVLFPVMIAMAASVAGLTSTSRTLWAFSRDDGTPLSSYISKVDDKKQIPLRAVAIITVLEMLLGLIYVGNSTAFNAVLSMAIIGMYISYLLPVACMLFFGRRTLSPTDYGPFKLNRLSGMVCNTVALVWSIVAVIFSTFPTQMPVTETNMNYSIVIMAGWIVLGLLHYVAVGRHRFKMPVVRAHVIMGVTTN
ncbi:amino acid permease [Fusarium sporotrichioides]|uniref:Amino acid permease n=1 Tax=Fusarium sporotrichioides TaxID=5514 RepID=A0A395RJD0_FUSSP|nr:amino acid permease [Fusarium sporotrichioides]